MSEKKRKRDYQAADDARKKVQLATANSTLVALKHHNPKNEIGPLIVSTAGCCPPAGTRFKAYSRVNAGSSKSEILLHSSAHSSLDYSAREEDDTSTGELLKHYVGVFNPSTQQLTLTEVPHLVVRSKLRPSQAELDEAEAQRSQQQNARDARMALGMEFGTKRAKKALLDRTLNAIAIPKSGPSDNTTIPTPHSKLTTAILNSMNANSSLAPTREERQNITDESKPRPTPNMDAETAEDVYPINSLLPRDLSRSLDVSLWLLSASNNEAVQTHSRFVSARIQRLAIAKEYKKLRMLKYILALIDFGAACSTTRQGGLRLPKERETLRKKVAVSAPVLDHIRTAFVAGGEMSKWHADLMYTNICALALHVDNFTIDMYDLREDLRIDEAQMTRYFRELGCTIAAPGERERETMKIAKVEASRHKLAKLKLPLSFPKEKGVVAKAKRRM